MSSTDSGFPRRTLLAGGLSAAGAWWLGSSCRRAPSITGSFAGPDVSRGHQLLDGAPPTEGPERDVPVAILGGGIAGLSAAWRLARAGFHDFELHELESRIGGTSVGGSNAISAYPWGAHYLPVPVREQRAVCELLEELGLLQGFDARGRALIPETALVRAPQSRLFYMGSWSEGLYCIDGASREDLAQWERFEQRMREFAERRDEQGRPWFALPLARCSPDARALELDRISFAQWLAREGFDSPRLLWMAEYACRDDYGCSHRETSAWAGIFYFASRETSSGASDSEFLTWPEGNAFLAEALARHAQGRIRTGALIRRIEPRDGFVRVESSAGALRCEQAICALPRFVLQRVLDGLEAERGRFRYSPWVTANLSLSGTPASRGASLAWDNVLHESESLGYVVATHQSDRTDPRSVWTWYRPLVQSDVAATRQALLRSRWEDWRDEVMRDLSRAHPDLDRHVQQIDVWRWAHAMVRPEPGFRTDPVRQVAAQPRGRLYFAHTDLSGLSLFEEAQWQGVRAAESVLSARGIPFESWSGI